MKSRWVLSFHLPSDSSIPDLLLVTAKIFLGSEQWKRLGFWTHEDLDMNPSFSYGLFRQVNTLSLCLPVGKLEIIYMYF